MIQFIVPQMKKNIKNFVYGSVCISICVSIHIGRKVKQWNIVQYHLIYTSIFLLFLSNHIIYICMWHDTLGVCMCDVIKTYNDEPFVTSTFLSHRLLLSCLEAELIVLLFPPKFSRTRPATTPPCTFAKLLFKISLLHLLQACRYIPVEIFFVSETLHNL